MPYGNYCVLYESFDVRTVMDSNNYLLVVIRQGKNLKPTPTFLKILLKFLCVSKTLMKNILFQPKMRLKMTFLSTLTVKNLC